MKRYFEFVGGSSAKFYEVTVPAIPSPFVSVASAPKARSSPRYSRTSRRP